MNPLINILFGGQSWGCTIIYKIDDGYNFKINVKKTIFKNDNYSEFCENKILIGVEYCCDDFHLDEIRSFLEMIRSKNNVGYYFYVKTKKQAIQMTREVDSLSLGCAEIYGIDPDYFYSIIPISSNKYRKNIEKFIINQKVELTIVQRCKLIIKYILIIFGLSDVLYEKFVVVVSGGVTNMQTLESTRL